jgi:dienelactone hydrolase
MFKPARLLIILLVLPLTVAANAHAAKLIIGKVVGVTDGDTIKVLETHALYKIRLYGIDCPERRQDFGYRAKQRVPDVYGALKILSTDPRIDKRRIALMGFSHGGFTVLMSATKWAKETFGEGNSFRVFISFYPYCNYKYPELKHITAPLYIHSGQLDDWTPYQTCEEVVNTLKTSGQNASIIVYPGAYHSFDNLTRYDKYLPYVTNGNNCHFSLPSVFGPMPPMNEMRRCLTKGATVGGNKKDTNMARQNVRSQLSNLTTYAICTLTSFKT